MNLEYLSELKLTSYDLTENKPHVYATGGNPENAKLKRKSLKYLKLNSKYSEKLTGDKVNIELTNEFFGWKEKLTGIPVVLDDSVDDFEIVYEE